MKAPADKKLQIINSSTLPQSILVNLYSTYLGFFNIKLTHLVFQIQISIKPRCKSVAVNGTINHIINGVIYNVINNTRLFI